METETAGIPSAPWKLRGQAAVITLDSARNRNALTPELLGSALASLDEAEASEARVLVLEAAGPAFCSGMDLRETDEARLRLALERLVELLTRLAASRLPVIARVQGAVRAGGIGLLGVADFVVAADTVNFAFTEVQYGLAPAVVSAPLEHRLDSRTLARLFLTAEQIDASEAARVGIVTHAVPETELDATVETLTTVLAAGHPQGMRETRALTNARILGTLERDGQALVETSLRLFTSEVAREAIDAARKR